MQIALSATKPRKKCAICKHWSGDKPTAPVLGVYLIEKENEGSCNCENSPNYNAGCSTMHECDCFELDDRYSQDNILENKKIQTYLHIPACVDNVGKIDIDFMPFLSLAEITVDENNKNYISIDGVLFNKDGKSLLHYPMMKIDKVYKIPEGTEQINFGGSFYLKELHLPATLKHLSQSHYDIASLLIHCELDILDIGKNTNICEHINALSMYFCPVKEFRADEDNEKFCTVDGVLYTKDMKTLLLYPSNKEDSVFTMPDEVETIRCNIFSDNLKEITISKNICNIDSMAFYMCKNLEKINVPDDHHYGWPADSFRKGFVLNI